MAKLADLYKDGNRVDTFRHTLGALGKYGNGHYLKLPDIDMREFTIPKGSVVVGAGPNAVAELAKKRLGISTLRVVGDLKQQCKTIYMAFGYMDPKMQIPIIQQVKPDLILSGETREWETVERVRDGQLMGQKTSLMVLSHAVSEEAGMDYAVQWLKPMLPGIPITHIASNNPFTFL